MKKKRADYDAAEPLYRRAIDIVVKTYNTKKHYKYGVFMNNLADIYRKRGQYPEALTMYQDSLDALKATLVGRREKRDREKEKRKTKRRRRENVIFEKHNI